MKKTLIATTIALTFSTSYASNFVSFDLDQVENSKTKAESVAQYFRAGKSVGDINLGLQVRTAVFDQGGMTNSIEATAGVNVFKTFGAFLGVGHDNGLNGLKSDEYQYSVVGLSSSFKIGPVTTYGGIKTRVNWDTDNPNQTIVNAGVSLPISKQFSVNAGYSKSFEDIKENSWGVGLRFNY